MNIAVDNLFGPMDAPRDGSEVFAALTKAAKERILILDGAMGTQIQGLSLNEDDFRGDRFADCSCHLQGNNDLLILTQPQAIEDIHYAYAMAGADILETNTFSSTTIAQADYSMEEVVYELNRDGARLARRAALKAEQKDGRRRFVAGALGPTNRTASISPDVNNPGYRAVTFDDLRTAYADPSARPHRWRRRHHPHRDHLRYAQRQGSDLRHERSVRREGHHPSGDDLRHDHRPLRPHAFRPDADRFLAFGPSRQAFHHRLELCAWRQCHARASCRDFQRRRYVRLRLSQCGPAQRIRPV